MSGRTEPLGQPRGPCIELFLQVADASGALPLQCLEEANPVCDAHDGRHAHDLGRPCKHKVRARGFRHNCSHAAAQPVYALQQGLGLVDTTGATYPSTV